MNTLAIFDFDGVLVATERSTFDYYREILPEYGFLLKEEDFALKVGRKSIDFFRDVMQDRFDPALVDRLVARKRQAFLEDIPRYLQPIPGAFELLKACEAEGMRMAIGSQNERELLERAVDVFGIRHHFEFIASLQDIARKKPDPEIYLLVCSNMAVPPGQAVVLEDSPVGLLAASNAGCASIGIATSFPAGELSEADMIVRTPAELTVETLRSVRRGS